MSFRTSAYDGRVTFFGNVMLFNGYRGFDLRADPPTITLSIPRGNWLVAVPGGTGEWLWERTGVNYLVSSNVFQCLRAHPVALYNSALRLLILQSDLY